jgi:hypothetical protein
VDECAPDLSVPRFGTQGTQMKDLPSQISGAPGLRVGI